MRDRPRLRGHATEEFRREQQQRRDFGLQRRYAHKALRRYGSVRAAAAAIQARVEELAPSPSPSPSPSIEPGRPGQPVPIAAAPATAAAAPTEAEVVDVAWAKIGPVSAEPPTTQPPTTQPPTTQPPTTQPPTTQPPTTQPVAIVLARAEADAARARQRSAADAEAGDAAPHTPEAGTAAPQTPEVGSSRDPGLGRPAIRPGPTWSTTPPATHRPLRPGRQRRRNGCRRRARGTPPGRSPWRPERGQTALPANAGWATLAVTYSSHEKPPPRRLAIAKIRIGRKCASVRPIAEIAPGRLARILARWRLLARRVNEGVFRAVDICEWCRLSRMPARAMPVT
jgi:hypothetical protein